WATAIVADANSRRIREAWRHIELLRRNGSTGAILHRLLYPRDPWLDFVFSSYRAEASFAGGRNGTRRNHSRPPPITSSMAMPWVSVMKPNNWPRPGSPRKNSMKYRPTP